MGNDYFFTSDRLGFRNWKDSDLDEFAVMNADEEVMEHFPNTLSRKEVSEFIGRLKAHYDQYGFTYYAVEVLASKEFIGMIGIAQQVYETEYTPAIDIGWRLKKAAWGKGYATEGAQRCLKYAFEKLGIDRIISICVLANRNSEHVMKKIGMKRIGEFDHPQLIDHPEYVRHVCYDLAQRDV